MKKLHQLAKQKRQFEIANIAQHFCGLFFLESCECGFCGFLPCEFFDTA